MSVQPKSETVLVTGGSGYVAGWMIVGLLRQGFRVRATLRSMGREAAIFQHEARFMAPMLGKRREFNTSKVASLLQWRPRPSKQAIVDCAKSMQRLGLV